MQTAIPIHIPFALRCTEEQFTELGQANPDLRWKLTAQGEVMVRPATGSETGNYNFDLGGHFTTWNFENKRSKGFDSSAGFQLPNGAIRSPDVAWIAQERWQQLSPEQRRKLASICPDFVLELVLPADNVATVQAKMQEYLENGAWLGWLTHPDTRTVAIYRPNFAPEIIPFDTILAGEDVLSGFTLDLGYLYKSKISGRIPL